jgi:hypothetical protein
MKKKGKSTKPNTGKRGTPHAKASEPTQRRKLLGSKSGSQKRKNLDRLARDYRDSDYSLDENLEQCRQKGEKYQRYARRSHRALYEALVPIYGAPIEAHANDGVDELRSKVVSICDYKPTKASNLRSIMSRVYLAVDAKTANTYGAAMDFAEIKGIKPNQLLKFLKKENGVHKCAKKFRELVSKKSVKPKKPVDETVLPTSLDGYKSPMIKLGPKLSAFFEKEVKRGERKLTITGPLEQDGTISAQRLVSEPSEASKATLRGILETPMSKEAFRKRAQIWADTGR